MSSAVYDKTDKGREEIATRKYQLPARMRTLLVLVDGRRPLEWLLNSVSGLGLNQQSIEELLSQELIRLVPGSVGAAAPAPAAAPASARARAVARQAARVSASATEDAIDDAIASNFPVTEALPAAAASYPAEQFSQLYAFYNRNIKAAIGLRGVMLQLKVEKAEGVEGLRELRAPFLQAVIKAKGSDVAIAMRDELDQLFGGAPEVDDVIMPPPGQAAKGGLDFFNMSSGAVEY